MKTDINTLEKFCDYVNSCDEWPSDAHEIIEKNGWKEIDNDWDVCSHNGELVTFGEDGLLKVVPEFVECN